jgi:hypothetical protein
VNKVVAMKHEISVMRSPESEGPDILTMSQVDHILGGVNFPGTETIREFSVGVEFVSWRTTWYQRVVVLPKIGCFGTLSANNEKIDQMKVHRL